MNSIDPAHSQQAPNRKNKARPLAGCCAGQTLGCGFSFLAGWLMAACLSALLLPLFGQSPAGNSAMNVVLSGLTCGGSLIMGGVLSFLAGRFFPVFQKRAG